MGYLTLVAGTTLTLITGWCVASLFASILEKVVTTLVIAVTQVVVTLLFAGYVVQSFSALAVLGVNLVVTGVAVAVVASTTSIVDRLRGSWTAARRLPIGSDLARSAWVWILGGFVALEVAYLSLSAYVLPPATWDSLTYHLVPVAEWIRANRVVSSPLSVLANASPLNGEMTFLWVGALTRSDLLVDLPQVGFAALGALAVVTMARTVGVSKWGSIAAGFLYFLTPVVLLQASTAYVDVIFPGLFLAGYALLLRFVLADDLPSRRSVPTLLIAGIACGLAAGSKSIGVIYAVIALVVLAVNLVWRNRHRQLHGRRALGLVAAFLVPVVAFGSFWYVRTWIEYGSPTYPYEVSYAGIEVFSGKSLAEVNQPTAALLDVPPGPLRTLVSWTHLTDARGYAPLVGGFGPQWLLLELPALLVFAAYLAVRRRRLLLAFVVPFVVMLAATPSNWWTRFTIAFVAPGAVALTFMIERIRTRSLVFLLQGAIVVAVAIGCATSTDHVTIAGRTFSAGDVIRRAADPASERTLGHLVLPGYAWTDTIPRGSRVAVDPDEVPTLFSFPWVYQLFGADFRNDVVALDATDVSPAELVETLRRRSIDYLVAFEGSKTHDVAEQHRGALTLVSGIDGVMVYRVETPARSTATS